MPQHRINPAFSIANTEAAAVGSRLRALPKPLARPVAVLAGYHSPKLSITGLRRKLIELTSQRPEEFEAIHFPGISTFEAAASRAHQRIGSFLDRHRAMECDIVALSMGGLIARVVDCNLFGHERPIPVRRIFTLSTPHQGAILADLVQPDPAAEDMERNSRFLRRLDAATGVAECANGTSRDGSREGSRNGQGRLEQGRLEQDGHDRAELVCYALLHDWWVGATRAAPAGHPVLWRDTFGVLDSMFSHFLVTSDEAILVDIALRLRGEPPIARAGGPPPVD